MSAGSKTLVHAAPAGNLAIALMKFVAAALTGSSAMWPEGIHSVVDSGNQALLRMRGKRGSVEAVKRAKDPTVIAVLFEDSAALAGLLVAFGGNAVFDAAASIVIGLILGATAAWLAFETKGLLIGESANREVVAEITRLARRYPEVEKVNEVLTMHMGHDFILANIERIKKADARVKRVFIESQNSCDPEQKGQSNFPAAPNAVRERVTGKLL